MHPMCEDHRTSALQQCQVHLDTLMNRNTIETVLCNTQVKDNHPWWLALSIEQDQAPVGAELMVSQGHT